MVKPLQFVEGNISKQYHSWDHDIYRGLTGIYSPETSLWLGETSEFK